MACSKRGLRSGNGLMFPLMGSGLGRRVAAENATKRGVQPGGSFLAYFFGLTAFGAGGGSAVRSIDTNWPARKR